MFAIILGVALTAFTYGGLSERLPDQQGAIPDWIEAVALGAGFHPGLAAQFLVGPDPLAAVLPSFLLFLSILTDRHPPHAVLRLLHLRLVLRPVRYRLRRLCGGETPLIRAGRLSLLFVRSTVAAM
ncbi:MAG: hypothetical protein WDN69_18325 [Aliidongia sp.]